MKQFDLIAFDWDGTLFDSTAIIVRSIQQAVMDVGGKKPSDAAANWVIGLGLMQALAHAAPDVPPEKYPELGDRYRHYYVKHQHDIPLFEGVEAMLHDLKAQGYILTVATGKSRRGLNEALRLSSMGTLFDSTRTADETAGKPHPLMLRELMDEFDIPAKRVLMVGDTTHDLQMALNAGCPSVGVSYGAHTPETLIPLHPLFIAHSVPALHQWLIATNK
ncbi:MAG: hypothetical protein RIR79_1200 [Pseudomonadota bacterium]|jgi:phosphoglycolate phosphatase